MVEIKGKLSDLFLFNNYMETNIELTEDLLESMINRPIIKDCRCAGIVKHVDKDKDEWSGVLFNNAGAEVSLDMKQCMSVKLLNL